MFLKRIEIFGFKSFATRTEVEFADGVTAIIGPNGCGKSNIVDAIKWVLGEQSTRSLRTGRMEEIIFSGTENAKALSVADVSMVLSNESGYLGIDNPEISIQRRLYRNGENTYFLNRVPVRLKEIREIFLDTGVGKSAYSVIEQGCIDQVLTSRPQDRRYLIEEAAGISRYKVQGSEGEKKLQNTQENIKRLDDILTELTIRYDKLEKQTAKTHHYREIKKEIFNLECASSVLRWQKIRKRKASLEEKHNATESLNRNIKSDIEKIREEQVLQSKILEEMKNQQIDRQKQLYGFEVEEKRQYELLSIISNQQKEYQKSINGTKNSEQNIILSMKSLEEHAQKREEELISLNKNLEKIRSNIKETVKSREITENLIKINTRQISELDKSLRTEENNQYTLRQGLQELTEQIVTQLDEKLKESGYNKNARQQKRQEIEKTINESIILSSGRAEMLIAQSSLGQDTNMEKSLNELIAMSARDFKALSEHLVKLRILFQDYRLTGVDFLGDFLSPEGIITKKRNYDQEIAQSDDLIRSYRDKITQINKENTRHSNQAINFLKTLEEMRISEVRSVAEIEANRESLISIQKQKKSEQIRLDDVLKQLDAISQQVSNLEQQKEKIRQEQQRLAREEEKISKSMKKLESVISTQNKTLSKQEKALAGMIKKLNQQEIENKRLETEIWHAEVEIKKLMEDFLECHSRDMKDFINTSEEKNTASQDSSDFREKIKNARKSLQELGQVNLMAPEEFQEVADRHKFLSRQIADLKKAKSDLEEVTRNMRTESIRRFQESLKKIRIQFREMFRQLFGGGRAEIQLDNEKNPLESGIEIYAQPPGKRLENIFLLSGGERSMCCIALMFALFKVRPSPFCILDEIDAALDESNIQRFIGLMENFSPQTQFLVITHNKRTISSAGNLLGITMQESGISSLVTIRLKGKEQ